jgi:hypothetical protein
MAGRLDGSRVVVLLAEGFEDLEFCRRKVPR